ncbi:hypothetical protein BCR36DRAFT_408288 [Piromyces finnis]|uniref:Uncharacterized protein n=1 Tax=Piromyces finnis TaxID=1754191 RepID=A0A1Y1VLV9_9FUNG|nr:hypothetical protein BCR36DRAFT_408288 [Piromyces finnis]|eukprot:ORX59917.1 hypothetical protein BCR36DRAFT_408288 [Piromyces finnis]
MKIRHIILIIYLTSGILFFTKSYPIYRNIENELKRVNTTRELNTNNYGHSNYKGNKKHIYSNPDQTLEENQNLTEKDTDEYLDENANVDRRYDFNSNNNFFSKFSMKSDENNDKKNRKNIMISIKASAERENYYKHPHSISASRNNKKWYNKIYRFFKDTYKKTKSNVIDTVYDNIKTGYEKVVREEDEKGNDERKFPIYDKELYEEDYNRNIFDDMEDNEDEENSYFDKKIVKLINEPFNKFAAIEKREVKMKNIKNHKNINTWYEDAVEEFETIYDKISDYTTNFLNSCFQTGKTKFLKLKGDVENWLSFYDEVKKTVKDTKENVSKAISFFREIKEIPSRLRGENEENIKPIEIANGNKEELDQREKDKVPSKNIFSFFQSIKPKNRNNRHFEMDEKTEKLLVNYELNLTELESNEIYTNNEKSNSISYTTYSTKSMLKDAFFSFFGISSFSFLDKKVTTKNKRNYNYYDNYYNYQLNTISRYLRKKDFDFGAGELVKGTPEWNNYNSYIEKMRKEELNYYKALEKENSVSLNKTILEEDGLSQVYFNETVNNKGRNNDDEFNHKNNNDLSSNMNSTKENNKHHQKGRFKINDLDEEEESIYILDYNTLRNGFPQYFVRKQRDQFRSNVLLSGLENFNSDEIFQHLSSKKKHSLTISKKYYWYTDREIVNEMYSELVSENDVELEQQHSNSQKSTITNKKEYKKREIIQKLKKRNSILNVNLNNNKKKIENPQYKNLTLSFGKDKINRNKNSNGNTPVINDGEEEEYSSDDENTFVDEEVITESPEDDSEEEDVVNMLKIDFVCNIEHFSEKICNKTLNVINRAGRRISSVIDLPSPINIKVTYSSYCKEFNECKTTTLGSSSPSYFYEFSKDFDTKRKKNMTEPLYYTDNEFMIDTNFSYPGALAKQRGPLNNGFIYDISLWLNGDWNWYFGRDQEKKEIHPKQYDLEQVVIHEYFHGFGFVSSWYNWLSSSNKDILIPSSLSWNTKKGGYHGLNKPYIYNKYLADVRDNKWLMDYQVAIINDFANYPVFDSYTKIVDHFTSSISYIHSQKIYEIFTTPESVVFWCKKPVNRAEPHWVVLYTNKKYKSGSTISHLDSSRYLKTSGFLMRPSGVRNVILDEYKYNIKNHHGIGDDILCILGTLGYRIKYDPSELEDDIPEEDLSTTNSTTTTDNSKSDNEKSEKEDGFDVIKKILTENNWTFKDTKLNNTNVSKNIEKTYVSINNTNTNSNRTNNINNNNNNNNKSKIITQTTFPYFTDVLKKDIPTSISSITTRKTLITSIISPEIITTTSVPSSTSTKITSTTIKTSLPTSVPSSTSTKSTTTTTTSNEKKFKFKTINAIFKQQIQ